MPSETDPLLPQGRSAPEIIGDGFSTASNRRNDLYDNAAQNYNAVWEEGESLKGRYLEDERSQVEVESGRSAFRTFAGLFVLVVGAALVIVTLMPGVLDWIRDNSGPSLPWGPRSPSSIAERVSQILSLNPLLDGHNDLAITIRMAYQNKIYGKNFTSAFELGGMVSQVDLPRLKAGHVGGSFWSAFTPCLANGTDYDNDAIHARSVEMTLSQIDLIRRLAAKYPETFASPLLNSTAALAAFRKDTLLISPIGIEGLHQIGHSLSNLRLYHSIGVKYATLTHNCYNHYADPALVQDSADWRVIKRAKPYWNGISREGMTAVREMNRMGMLIDLSHVSKATMVDVLGGNPSKFVGSGAPVIFSHSSAYALCPHPRNVPDNVLWLAQKTGSLVMVNVAPEFISCVEASQSPPFSAFGEGRGDISGLPVFDEGNATLVQVARHIIYIGELIGYDHVGIGSDFDGIPAGPRGLEDVSKFPDLVAELLKKGVSDENAAKVVGGNVLRVWGDVEIVARGMQAEGVLPAEDEIS